jgi:hypothetical protein
MPHTPEETKINNRLNLKAKIHQKMSFGVYGENGPSETEETVQMLTLEMNIDISTVVLCITPFTTGCKNLVTRSR